MKWFLRHVVPGLFVTLGLLVLLAIGGEIYLRITKPFVKPQWVSRFDPELGFTFEPGAIIRHTNHIDYWSEQKANTWGFLDFEPPAAGAHDTCRIAFVGDSFVEAAQVDIEHKFHRLIEKEWNAEHQKPKLETVALGYSGTGQANQLPWAKLIEPLRPNLIVLVFVSNDFSNNNVWLEAVRNGWHPEHAPRPFLYQGELRLPDPVWQRYLLPGQTGSAQASWSLEKDGVMGWLHRRLYQKSYLYSALNRIWIHYAYGAPAYYANVPGALSELRKLPSEQGRFGDWNPPADLTLDQMFMAEKMPPVFLQALEDTEAALRLWKYKAETMGTKVVVLATHTMKVPGLPLEQKLAQARSVREDLLFMRLEKIVGDLEIPLIDQTDFIAATGGDPRRASFPFDGHWNPYGHLTAAEAMKKWLEAHQEICTVQSR
jgi:hypothetical protein